MNKLFFVLVPCIALSVCAIAAPVISVSDPVYDFGSANEGIAVTHTFVIENAGNAVLEIAGIRASCGCTTTALETTAVHPGQSVELDILLNTAGFSGTISKTITITSNDPATPSLSLRVTGQVLAISPHQIPVSDAQYYLYVLVDLRTPEEYDAHHLFGSVNIPADGLSEALANLPQGTMTILYDADFGSATAASARIDTGFYSTYALVGGLNEWVYQYGMKYVTRPTEPYELPARVSYEIEAETPAYYMPANDLDFLFYPFIDVRTADAYAAGHILGAVNIPYAQIAEEMGTLPRTAPLIVYDQTGTYADAAALLLINNGFSNVHSLFGGLDEWILQFGTGYNSLPTSQ